MTSHELRHFPLTAEVAIAVLLFLYLPLAVVAWMSFNRAHRRLFGRVGASRDTSRLGLIRRLSVRRKTP